MNINWQLVVTIAAPIIALFVGVWVNRLFENRPRVTTYLAHASATRVTPQEGQPFVVHTHSIVVKNNGRRAATNLRLGHSVLPDFSVFPAVIYEVVALPDGGKEIVFPTLVPNDQVTVSYLYWPPLLWNQINTHAKSDDGQAKVLDVFPTPRPPAWLIRVIFVFLLIGITATAYVVLGLLGRVSIGHGL